MLDFYFWTTPNGYKITILLEELGWPYNVIPVNIGNGEQFKPDFLKISAQTTEFRHWSIMKDLTVNQSLFLNQARSLCTWQKSRDGASCRRIRAAATTCSSG